MVKLEEQEIENVPTVERDFKPACPSCDGEMLPHQMGQVWIDQCPKCQGLWVDEGEVGAFGGLATFDSAKHEPVLAVGPMTRYVNKRMALVINRMCWRLAGGPEPLSGNNVREGSSLGFIDGIHRNDIFGQKLYPTIYHQAAAYMYHIIKGHVFCDGNKRAGLAVALTFLRWNGIRFPALPEENSYQFVIEVASSSEPASEVIKKTAAWFHQMAVEG